MIRSIRYIRRFGVFQDYAPPDDIEELAECNIIYGWNYSGKTTLSRLFQSIENRFVHADYSPATFSLQFDGVGEINHSNLKDCALEVRVFNSDFIESNLSWDGKTFNPILLLGDQSIRAQQEIDKNEKMLVRLRDGYRKKTAAIKSLDDRLRDAKTKEAMAIRKSLKLVETYTATHLNQNLSTVRSSPNSYLLAELESDDLTKRATASEADKLPKINAQPIQPRLVESIQGLEKLLSTTPEMANSIRYLVENDEVARWVKEGLPLHANSSQCEFCGSALTADRLRSLNAHFSEDLANHEKDLSNAKRDLESARLVLERFHERQFYSSLRHIFAKAQARLEKSIADYNKKVDECLGAIDEKARSPFSQKALPTIDASFDSEVLSAYEEVSKIVSQNNQITDDFSKEKASAIQKLKLHYAANFCISQELERHENLGDLLKRHKDWFEASGKGLTRRNVKLAAEISHAQKGREELNQFIDKFLSGSNLAIEVVTIDGQERFRLVRNGNSAKNLSEGEKTAIAFAFFLTKLRELPKLEDAVVYIDDPISSLDSNHLFQVNALIRDFFYFKDSSENNQWKLRVKQIFFSTHNFEFLSLLKDMPIRKDHRCKRYFVKRLSPTDSTLINMPQSISRYTSEYQYLWSVIHEFHESADKTDLAVLLALPNAVRRFIELYTYSKIPSATNVTVDARAEVLFGTEASKRLLKVLHHFSHSNNLRGMTQNSDLIAGIENVVDDLVNYIKSDSLHYNALMEALG